jgi:hypothetical protein
MKKRYFNNSPQIIKTHPLVIRSVLNLLAPTIHCVQLIKNITFRNNYRRAKRERVSEYFRLIIFGLPSH